MMCGSVSKTKQTRTKSTMAHSMYTNIHSICVQLSLSSERMSVCQLALLVKILFYVLRSKRWLSLLFFFVNYSLLQFARWILYLFLLLFCPKRIKSWNIHLCLDFLKIVGPTVHKQPHTVHLIFSFNISTFLILTLFLPLCFSLFLVCLLCFHFALLICVQKISNKFLWKFGEWWSKQLAIFWVLDTHWIEFRMWKCEFVWTSDSITIELDRFK